MHALGLTGLGFSPLFMILIALRSRQDSHCYLSLSLSFPPPLPLQDPRESPQVAMGNAWAEGQNSPMSIKTVSLSLPTLLSALSSATVEALSPCPSLQPHLPLPARLREAEKQPELLPAPGSQPERSTPQPWNPDLLLPHYKVCM